MRDFLLDWTLEQDTSSITCFADLAELLLTADVSAVVGAGAAVTAGLPDWNSLLEKMASQADPTKLRQGEAEMLSQMVDDPTWRAEEYRQRFPTQRAYYDFLKCEFSKQIEPMPQLLIDIVRLNFKHIFTTNYDTALEQAHVSHSQDPLCNLDWYDRDSVRSFLSDFADSSTPRYYVHLHGICSQPEQIVLTYSDYVKRYLESDDISRRLFVVFATQHFVFIGFSLQDADFVHILREVNSRLGKGKKPAHYAILPCSDVSSVAIERRRLIKKFDVSPIFYNYIGGDHYIGLQKIVTSLVTLRTFQDITDLRRQIASEASFVKLGGANGGSY